MYYPLTPPWWQWQRHIKTKTRLVVDWYKSNFKRICQDVLGLVASVFVSLFKSIFMLVKMRVIQKESAQRARRAPSVGSWLMGFLTHVPFQPKWVIFGHNFPPSSKFSNNLTRNIYLCTDADVLMHWCSCSPQTSQSNRAEHVSRFKICSGADKCRKVEDCWLLREIWFALCPEMLPPCTFQIYAKGRKLKQDHDEDAGG